MIRSTIGHEIGHTAHLHHCPKSDIRIDANGKANWEEICIMFPKTHVNQRSYAAHHNRDYSLKTSDPSPQEPYELPKKAAKKANPKRTLSAANGSYTATAGGSHTANFTTSEAYTSVYCYVKTPSDTSANGTTFEIDQGNGTATTASVTYTFPTGVSGSYQILAYGYSSGGSVYETSYTVSVSLPAVSAPVWRDIPDPYNLTVGDYFYLVLSNYVSGSPTLTWDAGGKPAGLRFSSEMLSGEVKKEENRSFRIKATNSAGSAYSEWIRITVSAPVVTATRPDAPTGLSVSAGVTAGTVDFSWTAPADNRSPITDYKVAYGSYNNEWGGWTPYTSIGSTSTSYTVTGLESGKTYLLRMCAVNSLGDGRFSRYAQITVP